MLFKSCLVGPFEYGIRTRDMALKMALIIGECYDDSNFENINILKKLSSMAYLLQSVVLLLYTITWVLLSELLIC